MAPIEVQDELGYGHLAERPIDRQSHSYQLGVCQYERDKYKAALEKIAAMENEEDEFDAHAQFRNARAFAQRALK